jgi:murein DD-endopeptidase MepM/ murein hydrolase activator NlpD
VSIRRPHRRERLGRLGPKGKSSFCALLIAATLAGGVACAGYSSGFYHRVERGENLYRIGKRYEVEPKAIARANDIHDVTALRTGQRLWIPRDGGRPAESGRVSNGTMRPTGKVDREAASRVRADAKRETRRAGELDFAWPVRGARLTSSFGRRWGRPHEGVDLAARRGTRIQAAESGKVIHSGRLGDYGNVVIVKHAGNYRTVYAHARKLYVRRGQLVDKGQKIAEVGASGRASGPHLHFEIRQREKPRDPMLFLP